jgi:hypothetical protein
MLKNKSSILLAALILCFSTLLQAQENTAKAYVTLNPAGDFVATMKVISGFATVQDGKYKAKDVVIDLNSLVTGLDLRDNHAKNKYLEVKNPGNSTAILTDAVGLNGNGRGRIKMHGKESIVNGTYKVINGGKSLAAEFKLKLSAFGITEINYKGIGVEDDVRVEVTIPVKAEVAAATAPPKAPMAAPVKPADPKK